MSDPKKMTKKELEAKLKALGSIEESAKRDIICALIGHSRIQSFCFGYFNCSRCQEQLGYSLGGSYPAAKDVVIIGHDCEVCRKNYATLTWQDKYLAPDPFNEEKAA